MKIRCILRVFDTPLQLLPAEAIPASFSRKFTPPKPYGKLYLNHMILTILEQLVGGSTVRLFGVVRLRQRNQWIALFFTVVRRMLLVLSLCSIRNFTLFFFSICCLLRGLESGCTLIKIKLMHVFTIDLEYEGPGQPPK